MKKLSSPCVSASIISRELQEIRQLGRRQDVPDVPQPRPYLLELLKRRLRERRLLRRRARRPGNRLLERREVALLQRDQGRTTHAAHPEAGIENRSEVRRFVVRAALILFIVFGNIFPDETGKLPANVLVANQVQLAATASNVNNHYNTAYIYFFNGPQSGEYFQILSYNGATQVATLTTSMIVPLPLNGNYYDINYWNYDNVCPLRGSLTGPVLPIYFKIRPIVITDRTLVNGIGDMLNYPVRVH